MTGFYFGQKMARGCAELAMKKRSHDYFTGVNLRCGPEDWAQLRGRGGGGRGGSPPERSEERFNWFAWSRIKVLEFNFFANLVFSYCFKFKYIQAVNGYQKENSLVLRVGGY